MMMAERSKRIEFYDEEKLKKVNPENLKLYNKYEIDMNIKELSPKTIYNYKLDIYSWFIYIYENQVNQCILDLDEDDIVEFIYYCKQQGNNSRRIKRRMSSLSAFYKFLRKKRIIKENPMEFIERPRKDVDIVVQTFLTKEQIELMKQKLKEYGDLQLETYALLSLSTMGRVNAISNIQWKQIDFKNRTIDNVLEKEGKIVTLYFSEEVKDLLLKLKEEREKENIVCDYVFITKNNNKYGKASVNTLYEWAKKIGEMINVPTLHPHDFRHSGSQNLLLAGCPIETISELLNHGGLDVTRKFYLRQDKKKMREEKDRYEVF
jgi:integrase